MGGAGAAKTRLPSGTVTFLLSDVEGSSRLWEANPVEAAASIARHRQILAEAIARHRGSRPVEQGEGDSVVAVFERATDAVRAAHDAQHALATEPWPDGGDVRVRIALHSGEAVPAADGTYAGAVLNRCARLRALAHGGQVVLSEATRDLVVDHLDDELELVDLGTHRLRDLSRPERVCQLVGPGMAGEFPPLRSLDAAPNNLPLQLSSFVGREDDIALAVALLRETRLLTLTGSGGCGKTRLALQVAAEVSDGFGDGVWWVALAPLADGDLIASAIAGAIGLRIPPDRQPQDVVLNHLSSHTALIVLDNCEHVIEFAATLADRLLRAAPGVRLLATSREPLAVEGEVTWRVPSLAVPPEFAAEPESLGQYDAVRLFIERAVQVRPNFAVTNGNAPAVAEICHRLDGIPLAIELAAARTRVMAPDRIAAELSDRFRLLAGGARTVVPRQQTLVASIDWSHDLLDADERALFRRLGVFAGGFTLDAAEAVGAGGAVDRDFVLDVLARLVNKSLVQLDETSPERYRLLESIRHYALDRLEEAGEEQATRDRHVEWVVDLAEALEPATTNAHPDALDQLDVEHANIRAALEWATGAERVDDVLQIIAALGFFWSYRGHLAEALRWMAPLDEANPKASPSYLARARCTAGFVAMDCGDRATALRISSIALDQARQCGDRRTEARCLQNMSRTLITTDVVAVRVPAAQALDIAREVDDTWCESQGLVNLAFYYNLLGGVDEAAATLATLAPLVELLDSDVQRGWYHACLAMVAVGRGELEVAHENLQQAVNAVRRVGAPANELWIGTMVAYGALAAGRLDLLANVARDLTRQTRDWGGFGETIIPALQAAAALTVAPVEAAATLRSIVSVLISSGEKVFGTVFACYGTLAALEAGDAATARQIADETLRASADQITVAVPLGLAAGRAAMSLGDQGRAEDLAHETLSFQQEREVRTWLADTFDLLGRVAIAVESYAEGCRLIAAGDTFRAMTGQLQLPSAQREVEASLEVARAALGDDFDSVWAEGQALSVDEATAYARRARGERKRPSFGWDSLTPTELEVVRYVAQGLTNPAIGERMFITSGTVKSHLAHVFAKLGVTSRAELATAATKRQLE